MNVKKLVGPCEHLIAAGCVVALVAALAGCSPGFQKDVQQLQALREAVIARFNAPNVQTILTNGHVLTVALTNAPINDAPESEKQQQAREVARFAYAHYPGIAHCDEVIVVLVHEKRFLWLFRASTSTPFRFEVSTLQGDGV